MFRPLEGFSKDTISSCDGFSKDMVSTLLDSVRIIICFRISVKISLIPVRDSERKEFNLDLVIFLGGFSKDMVSSWDGFSKNMVSSWDKFSKDMVSSWEGFTKEMVSSC